jgi:PKD repeat protein
MDESSDSDGDVVSWSWDFGDGNTSTAQNPSHTYGAAGTYTVTLTVTDDGDATDSNSQDVTVTEPTGHITLSAVGYKVRGRQKADLTWFGAISSQVDVYRDGALLITTPNDGAYTDNIDKVGGGSYTYWVCEAGTSTCSNEAMVIF